MKKPQNSLLVPASSAVLVDLGQRIQRLRVARALPQAEIATRAGIARSTASRIENGDASVAIGQVIRYLKSISAELTLETLYTKTDVPTAMLSASERRQRARPLSPAALKEIDF